MTFKFEMSIGFDMPRWVEWMHDYVWAGEDEDD
jgi:hypothetical protein